MIYNWADQSPCEISDLELINRKKNKYLPTALKNKVINIKRSTLKNETHILVLTNTE